MMLTPAASNLQQQQQQQQENTAIRQWSALHVVRAPSGTHLPASMHWGLQHQL
jgi:hypothetical protein